jgi:hypothetical protein
MWTESNTTRLCVWYRIHTMDRIYTQ